MPKITRRKTLADKIAAGGVKPHISKYASKQPYVPPVIHTPTLQHMMRIARAQHHKG